VLLCFGHNLSRTHVGPQVEDAEAGEIIVLAGLEDIKIGDLAKKILNVVGVDKDIEPLKLESDKISRRCPDITKLKELCDYKPRVCLDEGLKIFKNHEISQN